MSHEQTPSSIAVPMTLSLSMSTQFEVVTLFPKAFTSFLGEGLLGKAVSSGRIVVSFTSPRDFGEGPHRQVDDTPYGGGPGMVLRPGPLVAAIEAAEARGGAPTQAQPQAQAQKIHKVLFSPRGQPFSQKMARRFAGLNRLMLVCGRYEGIDERVTSYVDELVSVGDFILAGGEAAAMIVIDAVSRLVPGVLGKAVSTEDESFETGLLEYPQYTRPEVFRGQRVPAVLLGGNHQEIAKWRRRRRLADTQRLRPDLLASGTAAEAALTEEEKARLRLPDDEPL